MYVRLCTGFIRCVYPCSLDGIVVVVVAFVFTLMHRSVEFRAHYDLRPYSETTCRDFNKLAVERGLLAETAVDPLCATTLAQHLLQYAVDMDSKEAAGWVRLASG
jgi:hypothetical protein